MDNNLNGSIQTVVVGSVLVMLIAILIPHIGSVADSANGSNVEYDTVTEFEGTTLNDDLWTIGRQPDDENISDISVSDGELEITQEESVGTAVFYESGYGVSTGMNLTTTANFSGWGFEAETESAVGFANSLEFVGETSENGTFSLVVRTQNDGETVELAYNYAEPGEIIKYTGIAAPWNATEDDLGQIDFRLKTRDNSSTLYIDDYGVTNGIQSYEIDESINYSAMPESTAFFAGSGTPINDSHTVVFGEIQAGTSDTNELSGRLINFKTTTATLVSFASLALVVPVVVAVIDVLGRSFGDLFAGRRGGRQ